MQYNRVISDKIKHNFMIDDTLKNVKIKGEETNVWFSDQRFAAADIYYDGVYCVDCNFQSAILNSVQHKEFFDVHKLSKQSYLEEVNEYSNGTSVSVGSHIYARELDNDVNLMFIAERIIGEDKTDIEDVINNFKHCMDEIEIMYDENTTFLFPIMLRNYNQPMSKFFNVMRKYEHFQFIIFRR